MPDALHPPLSVVESWPAPNYVDPVTRGDALTVVSIVLTSLATLAVAARIWARFVLIRKPGLDDALIVLSLCFGIAFTVTVIVVSTKYGDDRHVWDVPPASRESSRLYTWLAEWFFTLSTGITKISILLFYRRLTSGTYSTRFIWATRIGIWFNICFISAFGLTLFLECRPINAYWKAFGPDYKGHGTCAKEQISLPLSGVLSVISDFYATLLPFLLLRKLQLPRAQKLALYGVFSLGVVVGISGVLRTIYLYIALNKTYDLTWHVWITWIWSAVETFLAIICACAPSLKPFFIKYISNPSVQAYARTQRSRNASSQDYLNLSSKGLGSRREITSVYTKGATFQMQVIAQAEYSPPSDMEDKINNDEEGIRVHTERNVEYSHTV